MRVYTSEEILNADELYELQDSFSSSGGPFKYQLTEGEIGWAKFNKGKYFINDFVLKNTDEKNILTFNCPFELSRALMNDDSQKAIMLSDDTALQKLFFWLYMEVEEQDLKDYIDIDYSQICEDYNLSYGDISPIQVIRVDEAMEEISKVLNEFIDQNK